MTFADRRFGRRFLLAERSNPGSAPLVMTEQEVRRTHGLDDLL